MKRSLIILAALFITSCSPFCNCKYVQTESNPTTNYKWKQTFIDKWDATCSNEVLSNSTYTDSQNRIWRTKTEVKCK